MFVIHWRGAGRASTFNWVNLSVEGKYSSSASLPLTPVRGRTERGKDWSLDWCSLCHLSVIQPGATPSITLYFTTDVMSLPGTVSSYKKRGHWISHSILMLFLYRRQLQWNEPALKRLFRPLIKAANSC